MKNQYSSHVADHGGGSFAKVIPDRFGLAGYREIINADVLDAWYDPSPKVIQALQESLPWICRTSPPVFGQGLREVVADSQSLNSENVLVAGGSSEIIHLLAHRCLNSRSGVVILDPMYGEYAHVLDHILNCHLVRFKLSPSNGFAVDVDSLAQAARGADALFLVNPNNPTGYALSREEVLRLHSLLDPSTLLIVDETYVDFVNGRPSVEQDVARFDNLLVIKSLSKFYALSGLRAGYLVAPDAMIKSLISLLPPWAVSLPAQIAATEALSDPSYYLGKAGETDALRLALASRLRTYPGVRVFDGAANYVLVELLDDSLSASGVCFAMAERGIAIRNCATQGWTLGDRFVRFAVKDATANERMARAFAEVVQPAVTVA